MKTIIEKVIISIIVLIMAIVIFSCSKEKDNVIPVKTNHELIIGTWLSSTDSTIYTFADPDKLTIKFEGITKKNTGIYYFTGDTLHIWTGGTKATAKYIDVPIHFITDNILQLNDSLMFIRKK